MAEVDGRPNDDSSPPPPKRRRVAGEDDAAQTGAPPNGDVPAPPDANKQAPVKDADVPPPPSPPPPEGDPPDSKTAAPPADSKPAPKDSLKPPEPAVAPAEYKSDTVPSADASAVPTVDSAAKADAVPTSYNGLEEVTRVPRHATVPAKDEYQPAPAPPAPAAPAPMGEYSYAPPAGAAPDVAKMPSGLTPEVDAVLERIFMSGLFERKDIDGRALDFLGSVAPNLAMAALEDIQHRDFSTVRNKPAFIMSCFKRVVAAGGSSMPPAMPPPGGYPPTSVPASALAHLPPAVSDALQRVFTSGVCHPSQFDDRAMDILVDLHETDAVRALSEFAAMEPGRVRNPSAFWMGLARKYKGQSRRDPAMGGAYGATAGAGAGDGYGTYDRASTGYGAVDQRIQELINTGMLPPNPLDDRALEALRRLPEQDALSVLAELPEPQRIRNMSAYVMGLCKKFASGEARSQATRGYGAPYDPYGTAGAGYGMGAYGGGGAAYGAYGGATAPTGAAVGAVGVGAADAGETRRAIDAMDSSVRERFYNMVERGMFVETAFDQRAIGALQMMHRDEACAALDELAASDPARIHNISAYFMGLAKKFARAL